MPTITNTMNRPFEVPNAAGFVQTAPTIIGSGLKAVVNDNHWQAITKGNIALQALLDGGHLLVNGKKAVSDEDLLNPASPEMPDDLKPENDDEKVTVESVTEEVEVQKPQGRKARK